MSTSTVLTRDAFFAACQKPQIVEKEIEGIGTIRIAQLTAGSMEKIADENAKEKTGAFGTSVRTIAASVLDLDNKPIFENVDEVRALPSSTFTKLAKAVNTVNGFDTDEAAKN